MDWMTEIQDRLDTLDPGGWTVLKPIKGEPHFLPEIWHAIDNTLIGRMVNAQDAEFVAHAPTDIAKLIAAVRAQEKVIRAYESECLCRLSGSRCERCQGAIETLALLQSGEFPKEDA